MEHQTLHLYDVPISIFRARLFTVRPYADTLHSLLPIIDLPVPNTPLLVLCCRTTLGSKTSGTHYTRCSQRNYALYVNTNCIVFPYAKYAIVRKTLLEPNCRSPSNILATYYVLHEKVVG